MATKRKIHRSDEVLAKNFFTSIQNQTICLICGFTPVTASQYHLQRHYETLHSESYADYSEPETKALIEGLKLVYCESRFDLEQLENETIKSFPETSSEKAVAASYAVSLLIGKNCKPFADGNLIKQCLIETIKAFGNNISLEEAKSISLSERTVARRIANMNESVENKIARLLNSCDYFSLCLDESTDNKHVSNLSIFVRIV